MYTFTLLLKEINISKFINLVTFYYFFCAAAVSHIKCRNLEAVVSDIDIICP